MPSGLGADKICTLSEAVRSVVRPGMSLHFTQAGTRWTAAAIFETVRLFWGQKPGFTLIGNSMNHPPSVLVHGGLVKKIITSYCGDPYFTPGPNGVYQRAFRNGSVEIENWSILTLPLRLRAAAMGLPFTTTRSLIGSAMETDNAGAFRVIDDPFGSGEKIGLLRALHPDVSFVHAWAADREGNALLGYPLAENTYGAMASRAGAVVTAEKIVDTGFIREHAHLNLLPGRYVRHVCPVPFGAHPGGMFKSGLPGFDGYAEDYEFVEAARQASKDPTDFGRWVDEWVLGCPDHAGYLRRLGRDRLLRLKGRAQADSWLLESYTDSPLRSGPAGDQERMLAQAGARLQKEIAADGYQTILAGAGVANLAAWLAHRKLSEAGFQVELMAEVGLYGYDPRPYDPAVFNQSNFFTCKALTDTQTVMGIYMGGADNRCAGVMGFGQIDRFGNINTTKIPGKTFITGSGGGNDIASLASAIFAVGAQSRSRLVPDVPYVTSPGRRVRLLITDLGIYEKSSPDGDFVLKALFEDPNGGSPDESIARIRETCGWDLKTAPDLETIPPPAPKDVELLRHWDPKGYFL